MEISEIEESETPVVHTEPAPPIQSRFLFVDGAATRAKQLRRGAIVRLPHDDQSTFSLEPHKAERLAMEEVRRGLVWYEIPDPPRGGQPAPQDTI